MNTLLSTTTNLVPIALTIAIAVITLIIGGFIGYALFRYIIKQKYNKYINDAEKEAETIKKNKLLEVKEKFLNKKTELEKEVAQRIRVNIHQQQLPIVAAVDS